MKANYQFTSLLLSITAKIFIVSAADFQPRWTSLSYSINISSLSCFFFFHICTAFSWDCNSLSSVRKNFNCLNSFPRYSRNIYLKDWYKAAECLVLACSHRCLSSKIILDMANIKGVEALKGTWDCVCLLLFICILSISVLRSAMKIWTRS